VLYRTWILVYFRNNTELKREMKRHLILNLAVRVLTTYPINIPFKKKVDGIKKKDIRVLEKVPTKSSWNSKQHCKYISIHTIFWIAFFRLFQCGNFSIQIHHHSVLDSFRMVGVYSCEWIRLPVLRISVIFRCFLWIPSHFVKISYIKNVVYIMICNWAYI